MGKPSGLTNEYADYYKNKLRQGAEFEDFVVDALYAIGLPVTTYKSQKYQYGKGESRAGVEIKNDEKLSKTGNLYIEAAEKSHPDNPEYVKSGIHRNDNTWLYVIGDRSVIFIFSKTMLQLLDKAERYEYKETATSRGFLLPCAEARKYAAKILVPVSKDIFLGA